MRASVLVRKAEGMVGMVVGMVVGTGGGAKQNDGRSSDGRDLSFGSRTTDHVLTTDVAQWA